MQNSAQYLAAQFAVSKALGDRSLSSDALMVIEGFEYVTMLLKGFPWPIVSTSGEVEIWLPGGQRVLQPAQLETAFSGNVIMTETSAGTAEAALAAMAGQTFDATLYEGSPLQFSRACIIRGCFFKVEAAERSFEDRTQVTQYSIEMSYHYYDERIPGIIIPAAV